MHTIRRITLLAITALLATMPACASAPPPDTSASTTSSNLDVLTAAEIDQRNLGDRSLLDIIRLTRSQYLTSHGTGSGPVQVAVGAESLTGVGYLTNILGRDVEDVRYLSAASAAQRFGSSASMGPVLLVRHK